MYIGVNVVCIVLNMYNCDGCDKAAPDIVFHNLEFWASFLFNLACMFSIFYSPKKLSNAYRNPLLLKLFLGVNIGMCRDTF